MQNTKDTITSHLDKSIISNIRQVARASLKEPTRPCTPGEAPRSLFTNSELSRPPSSYSIKALAQEVDKKLSFEVPTSTSRSTLRNTSSSKPCLQPMKIIQSDELFTKTKTNINKREKKLTEESPRDRTEVKLEEQSFFEETFERELDDEEYEVRNAREVLLIIRKLQTNDEDLEDILERLSFCVRGLNYIEEKPSWAQPESMLKQLIKRLDKLSPEEVLLCARYIIECLLDIDHFFSKKTSLGFGVIKLVYQYSKEPSNDVLFCETGVIDVLYNILANTVNMNLEESHFDLLIFVFGCLKNTSSNAHVQEKISELNYIAPISSLLPSPFTKNVIKSIKYSQLLVQVTGALKNFTHNPMCYEQILLFQIPEKIGVILHHFMKNQEIVHNALRVLSSLSENEKVCEGLMYQDSFLSNLIRILEHFRGNAHIAIRCCYILANIVTLFEKPRLQLGVQAIYKIHGLVISSFTGSRKEEGIDALVKATRLIANIVIGTGEDLEDVSAMLESCISVLSSYDLNEFEELVLNTSACLTNILYFDTSTHQLTNPEVRKQLLSSIIPLLLQTLNEEITLEAVRILGNLTRHEEICKEPLQTPEILFLLLDHPNCSVVYFSLGCLINMSSLAKASLYSSNWFSKLTEMLEEAANPSIALQICLVLSNLCTPGKGLVPWQSVAGEKIVGNLKETLTVFKEMSEGHEDEEWADLNSVIELLIESFPKGDALCPYPDCGRKFASEELLKEHWTRRHINN